jgi:hypothetical protein
MTQSCRTMAEEWGDTNEYCHTLRRVVNKISEQYFPLLTDFIELVWTCYT